MIQLKNSTVTITSKFVNKSRQSRQYYERSLQFEELTFNKNAMECILKLEQTQFSRLDEFLKKFDSEEYYIEIPSGNIFFTSRQRLELEGNAVRFSVFKEEKISYPEKQKV